MLDDLLPPLPVIRDRLTANQRERVILRALFRLAVRAEQYRNQARQERREPRPGGDGRGVDR